MRPGAMFARVQDSTHGVHEASLKPLHDYVLCRLELDMQLDINTDIYPVEETDTLKLALSYTLDLDGGADEGNFGAQTQAFLKGQKVRNM